MKQTIPAGIDANFLVLYFSAIIGNIEKNLTNIKNTKETMTDICKPDMANICAHPDLRILFNLSLGIKLLFPVNTSMTIPDPIEPLFTP